MGDDKGNKRDAKEGCPHQGHQASTIEDIEICFFGRR
jgi:hypothetical protein